MIVGVNPATPISLADDVAFEDYARSLTAIEQFLPIYNSVRAKHGKTKASKTRHGLDAASKWLADCGFRSVLDTNISPYPTNKESEWRRLSIREKALWVFPELVSHFQPSLVLLHGDSAYEWFTTIYAPSLRQPGPFLGIVFRQPHLGRVTWPKAGSAEVFLSRHMRFFRIGGRWQDVRSFAACARRSRFARFTAIMKVTNADAPVAGTDDLAKIVREMAYTPALVAASTVAIVGARAKTVRQIGSATLLAVADARFIVTAAHVLVHAKEHGMTVGISGGRDGALTALSGNWIVTSSDVEGNRDDKRDIALYRLDERQVSRLFEVEFVRIADISFVRDFTTGYFIVCGFPGIWATSSDSNAVMMKSKLLQYGTYTYAGNPSGLYGYHADHHILLEATPGQLLDHEGDPTNFRTRSGHWAEMPRDLAGISGCSVWIIGDFTTDVSSWANFPARIVGVETGVFQRVGAIKVTRWNAVLSVLHGACPDLRPSIEMYVR